MLTVDAETVKRYQEDGAVCIRNVFEPKWVEKVAEGIKENLQHPSEYSEKLKTDGGPGYYFNDYCNWRNIEPFSDFVYHSPCAQLVASLMQSKAQSFLKSFVHLVKWYLFYYFK
jgi:ectoine hydroxylase-related dioxygenase (phytanoyl-CoA dioxygenase family)